MKGNFLISLVTANTTYTTFDVVYSKIMLYTLQVLFSNPIKAVYTETRVVHPQTQMFLLELEQRKHMIFHVGVGFIGIVHFLTQFLTHFLSVQI